MVFAGVVQLAGRMQERALPVFMARSRRVRVEDVLAHVEGGVDEMSDEEVLENTVLGERHEELLNTNGYRLVRLILRCAIVAATLWSHKSASAPSNSTGLHSSAIPSWDHFSFTKLDCKHERLPGSSLYRFALSWSGMHTVTK